MKVILHQDICEKCYSIDSEGFSKQMKKSVAVSSVDENRVALVSATHDMVKGPGVLDS